MAEVASVGDYKGVSPDKMMGYTAINNTTTVQVLKDNTEHIHLLTPPSLKLHVPHVLHV